MKLLSVMTTEGPRLAARVASGILIFSDTDGILSERLPATLQAALSSEGGLSQLLPDLQAVADHEASKEAVVPENSVRVLGPTCRRTDRSGNSTIANTRWKATCHFPETAGAVCQVDNLADRAWRRYRPATTTREVDYEAELAVIIGRKCSHVRAQEAFEYVAGYTCMNDVSARDFQHRWPVVRAKSQVLRTDGATCNERRARPADRAFAARSTAGFCRTQPPPTWSSASAN